MQATKMIFAILFVGAAGVNVSPVQKVIQLLDENKVKITNDLAAEEKEMGEYSEFCDKESTTKGYAVKDAVRKIGDLGAAITDCDSKIPMYEDSIATLGSEVAEYTDENKVKITNDL